jgi:hypothetical protein
MVSVSVPGMYGWGNPSSQLPGVLGSSPYHRSGLGAPFFVWGNRVGTTSPRQQGPGTQDGSVYPLCVLAGGRELLLGHKHQAWG